MCSVKNIWSDRYFSTPALSVSSSPLLPSPLSSDAQKEREKETEQEKQEKQKEKEKTNQHQEEEKEEQKEVEEEMYFASYLKNNTGKYGGREREREENGLWLRVILTLLYSFLSLQKVIVFNLRFVIMILPSLFPPLLLLILLALLLQLLIGSR